MIDQVIDLGFTCRSWQAEVFKAFKRFNVLIVHRRGGKTILAILKLISAALKCDRPLARFGYIAPELKQAKGIAWDYLKSYARKVPGTVINESELYARFPNGAQVRLFGADNPASFRGLYFDGVVPDEVAEMPRNIWSEILLPSIADRGGWVLFIGTFHGINLLTQLYYKAKDNPDWYSRIYTYRDTKALPDAEVEQMRREMTPTEFKQEMECDPTASDDDTLIPQDLVRAAAARILEPSEYEFAPRILGVDVAWTGGDRSVIFKRQGLMSWEPHIYPGLPEKLFYAKVAKVYDEWKPHACFIDVTGGYGGEVLSRLQEAGYDAQGVKFSWKAADEKFMNLRAEMWFALATWVKDGAKIPQNESLIAELCTPRYSNDNASNKLKLESKEDLKERLGFSPDIADAAALCFSFPVYAPAIEEVVRRPNKLRSDFDPYADDP